MLHGATEHPYRSKCGDFVCIFPQASGGCKRPLVSRWMEKAGFGVGIGVRKWVTGLLREDGYAGDLSEQTSKGRSERTDRASLLVLTTSPLLRPGQGWRCHFGGAILKRKLAMEKMGAGRAGSKLSSSSSLCQALHIECQSISFVDVADEKGESGQGGMYVGGRKTFVPGARLDPDPVPWMHIQETGQSCLHVCEYIAGPATGGVDIQTECPQRIACDCLPRVIFVSCAGKTGRSPLFHTRPNIRNAETMTSRNRRQCLFFS